MSDNKTQPTDVPVDDFINAIDNARRQEDARTLVALYESVTGLEPVMWGPTIIGFGTHHYEYASGRTGSVPAAGFSPRKANLVFYVGDGFKGAEALYARLGKYRRSVSCLYVNKLADVDVDVLRQIVAADFEKTTRAGD